MSHAQPRPRLPRDVLDAIAGLVSRRDLVAVAAVDRAWADAAIPLLWSTLKYGASPAHEVYRDRILVNAHIRFRHSLPNTVAATTVCTCFCAHPAAAAAVAARPPVSRDYSALPRTVDIRLGVSSPGFLEDADDDDGLAADRHAAGGGRSSDSSGATGGAVSERVSVAAWTASLVHVLPLLAAGLQAASVELALAKRLQLTCVAAELVAPALARVTAISVTSSVLGKRAAAAPVASALRALLSAAPLAKRVDVSVALVLAAHAIPAVDVLPAIGRRDGLEALRIEGLADTRRHAPQAQPQFNVDEVLEGASELRCLSVVNCGADVAAAMVHKALRSIGAHLTLLEINSAVVTRLRAADLADWLASGAAASLETLHLQGVHLDPGPAVDGGANQGDRSYSWADVWYALRTGLVTRLAGLELVSLSGAEGDSNAIRRRTRASLFPRLRTLQVRNIGSTGVMQGLWEVLAAASKAPRAHPDRPAVPLSRIEVESVAIDADGSRALAAVLQQARSTAEYVYLTGIGARAVGVVLAALAPPSLQHKGESVSEKNYNEMLPALQSLYVGCGPGFRNDGSGSYDAEEDLVDEHSDSLDEVEREDGPEASMDRVDGDELEASGESELTERRLLPVPVVVVHDGDGGDGDGLQTDSAQRQLQLQVRTRRSRLEPRRRVIGSQDEDAWRTAADTLGPSLAAVARQAPRLDSLCVSLLEHGAPGWRQVATFLEAVVAAVAAVDAAVERAVREQDAVAEATDAIGGSVSREDGVAVAEGDGGGD
ncbi:hypothetical protein HK405_012361, partial [Cladochytrium tenue]